MKCNVGPRERIARFAIGAGTGIAALTVPMSTWKRVALGAVAAAEITTAAVRYCPVNQVIGVDNCPEGEEMKHAERDAIAEIRGAGI